MKAVNLLFFAFLWSPFSQAVEAVVVDANIPLEQLLPQSCPWIKMENVARVKIMDPQDIGKVGGAVGKVLGKWGKSSGVVVNKTTLRVNVPEGVRAILFDTTFYTNGNNAELNFEDLRVVDEAGNQWSAGTAVNVLQHESQTLLLCFVNGEKPVLMSTTVSSLNVDGTRPTVGVSVLQSTNQQTD